MASKTAKSLVSLGHAAALYQRDPRELLAALAVVQAEEAYHDGLPIRQTARPALELNGVAFFVADEVARAVGWLAESDAKSRKAALDV